MTKWNNYKRRQFKKDLQVLLDTYGIHTIIGLSAGYDLHSKQFELIDGTSYFWADSARDRSDAEELVRQLLYGGVMDKALESGDWETCMEIHKQMFPSVEIKQRCFDCDVLLPRGEIRCKQCNKTMCHECYQDGHGICAECTYGKTRMI